MPSENGRRVAGVLGGMGPLATVEFLRLVMANTETRKDWDHVRIVADIHPHIPSRSRHHLYGEASPVPGMIDACRRLADYPVDFVVVPCNSAAAFVAEVAPYAGVPIESIVDATVAEIARRTHKPKRVAVLGGVVTYDRRLYEPRLAEYGMAFAAHGEPLQRRVEALIETLKTDGGTADAQHTFEELARDVISETGADFVVLGCTELSMIDAGALAVPSVDSAAALARHTVRLAGGRVRGETDGD